MKKFLWLSQSEKLGTAEAAQLTQPSALALHNRSNNRPAGCSNRRPPIENYKQRPWQPDRWQSNGVALIRRAPLTGHKQTQTPRLCCLCIPRLDCTVIKWLGTRTLFFKNIFLYVHVRGILASISEDSSDSRADVVDFPKIPAHNKFLKR